MVLTTSASQSHSSSSSSRPTGAKGKGSRTFGSAFRRVGQYFKEQALNNARNPLTLYLSPPDTQWIQRNDFIHELRENDPVDAQLYRKLTVLNQYAPVPPPYSRPDPNVPSLVSSRLPSYEMSSAAHSVSGPGMFQDMTRHQYASDNILQSYDVLVPNRKNDSEKATSNKLWVIFIHGGYFRDPKIDSTSFKSSIALLEDSPYKENITGYCSINYRLAVHNVHPQDPNDTPKYTLNNAHWPDQPSDILHALAHLQQHHPTSKNYILSGHSVGATLAFLAALDSQSNTFGIKITPPKALLGVSGIYDFPAIHKSNPSYEILTENAMDKTYYAEASPALYDAETYAEKWRPEQEQERQEKCIVVLAHSRDDGLVIWDQPEEMLKVFDNQPHFEARLIELHGQHNPIVEKGTELARAIESTIEMVCNV